jgi:hypothetical protein
LILSTGLSERARSLATVLGAGVVTWVLVCASASWLADQVEVRLDANLWRYEEWMQLTEGRRYPAGAHDRILVIGPSEAREAFWPEPFREILDGSRLVNDSLSLSTFEDAITQLEYVEKVYGNDRLGGLLIVAVTPRFLQNYAPGDRPLPIVINRYSPYMELDESVEPQRLVEKSFVDGLIARIHLAGHSGARFTKALLAIALAAECRIRDQDFEESLRAHFLVGARFYAEVPRDKARYYEIAKEGGGFNLVLRTMNPLDQRSAILRDFDRLRAIAARNGIRILVVNLPEGGWSRRDFYNPGIHEAYMSVLREGVGDLPFLDLRDVLDDDGFVDWVHPTRAASVMISRKVAMAIGDMELQ